MFSVEDPKHYFETYSHIIDQGERVDCILISRIIPTRFIFPFSDERAMNTYVGATAKIERVRDANINPNNKNYYTIQIDGFSKLKYPIMSMKKVQLTDKSMRKIDTTNYEIEIILGDIIDRKTLTQTRAHPSARGRVANTTPVDMEVPYYGTFKVEIKNTPQDGGKRKAVPVRKAAPARKAAKAPKKA